jgi:peptidoglycan/LPS O-acetylase OafA/YrhL
MLVELWQGARSSARQCATVGVGTAGLALAASFFIEPNQVHQDFYAVLATTVPILLFALLVRLAAMRDLIVETLDEVRRLESLITEMREKARPEDSPSRAKLDELSGGRERNAKELGELAPRMLVGLLAALLIAALAEVACFAALAMNESTAGTFYISTMGTAVVAYSVASNEVATYKLSFGERGLMLPAHLKKGAKN